MTLAHYVVEVGGVIREEPDVKKCAEWLYTAYLRDFMDGGKIVKKETIGNYLVSTVFLTLDHQFGEGPPLLFETMVFPNGSWDEEYMERYSTYQEALEGHKVAVEYVYKELMGGGEKS